MKLMENPNPNIQELKSIEDIRDFLNIYRGSGITTIIKKQFLDLYNLDDQLAFSSLGNFLDLLIKYDKEAGKQEMKDDYIYHEIRDMLNEMSKKPEYSEYSDYLTDKIENMKTANLLKD